MVVIGQHSGADYHVRSILDYWIQQVQSFLWIVTVVAIDKKKNISFPRRRLDCPQAGGAITPLRLSYNYSAGLFRNFGGLIGRSIIGDNYPIHCRWQIGDN